MKILCLVLLLLAASGCASSLQKNIEATNAADLSSECSYSDIQDLEYRNKEMKMQWWVERGVFAGIILMIM